MKTDLPLNRRTEAEQLFRLASVAGIDLRYREQVVENRSDLQLRNWPWDGIQAKDSYYSKRRIRSWRCVSIMSMGFVIESK